ncbi:reverse transcriptase domain-containing protein [Tanacetum coccineum]
MCGTLFTSIVEEVAMHCAYFRDNIDCTGRACISPLMMCTSAIRQLAYTTVLDALDEYLQMGEAIACLSLGQYYRRDHGPNPFILLEAVASQDLWIWHAFFGVSEANNDIKVIQ